MAYKFQPKKPVRSFRDLEVYQKVLDCSVVVTRSIGPTLAKLKYPLLEGMANCCLSLPVSLSEAHSLRFSDFPLAVSTLEKTMTGCNRMIVYLEQAKGLYGEKLDSDAVEDLMHRYMEARGKMFRLEVAWKRYRQDNPGAPPLKAPVRY